MSIDKISTGYIPRYHQDILHRKIRRFNVLVCHRRWGKTVFCVNELIDQALRNPRKNPQYAYIAPTYSQAKRVVWEMFKQFTACFPNATTHEQELRIDIPRPSQKDKIRILLLGAEKPDSLRGIYLDGCVLDEYADCSPIVWGQVVRPALSDRLGWAIFIGTPKGENHFHEIYQFAKKQESWMAVMYKASETQVVLQSELDEARAEMTEEEYAQEFECSFSAALMGAYFGKEMEATERENRLTKVAYDKNALVHTYWDLGISDTTAIWFVQEIGNELHCIDYLESSGVGLDWYAAEIKKKEYLYGDHYLPHDGAARELGTGKSRQETLRNLGLRTIILPRWTVPDRIHAARMILKRTWFDASKCERGILALKNFERKWDAKNKIFQDRPKHNWASHGADAFTYMAQGHRPGSMDRRAKSLPRYADSEYDMFGGY